MEFRRNREIGGEMKERRERLKGEEEGERDRNRERFQTAEVLRWGSHPCL
jgi:hypothetical protein